jgi:hypothetical protein
MNRSDRLGFAGFFIACLFLAFLGGTYIVLAKVFPYQYIDNAYKAFQAVVLQRSVTDRYTQTDQWRQARTDKRGITLNDPKRTYTGYTLYTSAGGSTLPR